MAERFRLATDLPDPAEDIAQEALIKLWELIRNDYPVKDVEALAVKITKNLCVDRLRKRRLKQLPIIGDDYKGGDPASNAVDEADLNVMKEVLYEGLTDTQKKYIIMRNEWGLTLDEISNQTGKPKPIIKVTIANARKIMLKKLEGKTIVEYNTSVSTMIFDGKRQLVKVHQIRTADYKPKPGLEDVVLYIDGEIVDKAAIEKLEAKDIESMVVNKSEGWIRVFLLIALRGESENRKPSTTPFVNPCKNGFYCLSLQTGSLTFERFWDIFGIRF